MGWTRTATRWVTATDATFTSHPDGENGETCTLGFAVLQTVAFASQPHPHLAQRYGIAPSSFLPVGRLCSTFYTTSPHLAQRKGFGPLRSASTGQRSTIRLPLLLRIDRVCVYKFYEWRRGRESNPHGQGPLVFKTRASPFCHLCLWRKGKESNPQYPPSQGGVLSIGLPLPNE